MFSSTVVRYSFPSLRYKYDKRTSCGTRLPAPFSPGLTIPSKHSLLGRRYFSFLQARPLFVPYKWLPWHRVSPQHPYACARSLTFLCAGANQADMGHAAPALLDVWIYFNLVSNTVLLPILVATFLFSRRAKRHFALINVCITWILSGVFALLLCASIIQSQFIYPYTAADFMRARRRARSQEKHSALHRRPSCMALRRCGLSPC